MEPTITKGVTEDPVPVVKYKAPPPLDQDVVCPPKPYVKPAPAHLAQVEVGTADVRKAEPPPANLDTITHQPLPAPPPPLFDVHDHWNDDDEDIEEVVTPIVAMARAASPVRVQ